MIIHNSSFTIDRPGVVVAALMLLLPGAVTITHAETSRPQQSAATCQGNVIYRPFAIGSKEEIGTVSTVEKAASGLLGGTFGGFLGEGASVGETGNAGADDLEIIKSPIRDFQIFTIPNSDIRIDVGAQIAADGKLLVSSKIKNAPGKGTFHNIYLHNMGCQQMSPFRYFTYGAYRDWSLQVQYTHITEHYRGNSLINRDVQTTDWKEIASGRETIGGIEHLYTEQPGSGEPVVVRKIDDKIIDQGIWKDYGFNRATDGINWIGTEFNTRTMDFDEPLVLSISITSPDNDPVLAVPLNLLTYQQHDGSIKLFNIEHDQGVAAVVMGVPITREAFNRWMEAGASEGASQQQPADGVTGSLEENMVSSFMGQWSQSWSHKLETAGDDKAARKDIGDEFMEAFSKAFGSGEVFKFEFLDPEPEDSMGLDDNLVTFRYKVYF